MADVIQLLPDHIANQIAAGEVVQRPASVVKELMENAIDAGSTEIKLVVKDAGKALIQVIDNGCGMSETDLRMSFERHATSKIRNADDLFAITTMGFRGEALASIAAIAQVEVRSKQANRDLGTRIVIEESDVKTQEACQTADGTTFTVKNLFFNVPARRKFLKTNAAEMNHIINEFQRVALANPSIFFSLHHNDAEMFHLQPANLRQRIVGVFGNKWNKKLVPIGEDTEVVSIKGFVGKPEFSRKKRGDQYFFVNNRFVKSGYLHHAVMNAYDELLQKGTYPLYVIFIEIDPASIDINVHPTKTEIKFDDERLVYDYLKVATRHALGQYNISPTLDFNQETFFTNHQRHQANQIKRENVTRDVTNQHASGTQDHTRAKQNIKNWQKLFDGLVTIEEDDEFSAMPDEATEIAQEGPVTIGSEWKDEAPLDDAEGSFSKQSKKPYQVHNCYIVSQIKSGFLLIDQQAAHERILYEQYLNSYQEGQRAIQQLLFPKTLQLTVQDAQLFQNILPQVNYLGFDIKEFGNDSFIIHGIPSEMTGGKEEQIIEKLLEQYKENVDLELDIFQNLACSLAHSTAIKRGQELTEVEMQALIDQLFACEMMYQSPRGNNCFITFDMEELVKRFKG